MAPAKNVHQIILSDVTMRLPLMPPANKLKSICCWIRCDMVEGIILLIVPIIIAITIFITIILTRETVIFVLCRNQRVDLRRSHNWVAISVIG